METMPELDATRLDELARLRRERQVLEQRLEAMENRRGSVSEEVFERVRGDYLGRRAALDEEARPLRTAVRADRARFEERWAAGERELAEARLELEEVELRRELGELDEAATEERREEVGARITAREEALEALEGLRERFMEALGDDEEDEQADDEPTAAEPVFSPAAEAEADAGVEVLEPADEEEAAGPPIAPPAAAGDAVAGAAADDGDEGGLEEVTWEVPSGQAAEGVAGGPAGEDDDWHEAATGAMEAIPAPPSPPAAGPAVPPSEEGTRLIPQAAHDEAATRLLALPRLVSWEDDEPGQTFVLGETQMTIGRSSDNPIHLLEESISRRHAVIVGSPEGYLVRDLGSENGTYVNGQRVDEHLLRDGDVLHVGIRKLVFHEA